MNAKNKITLIMFLMSCSICLGSVKQLVEEGNSLYRKGDYAAAQEKYQQAIIAADGNFVPEYNKALTLYKQGKYDQAVRLFQQLSQQEDKKKARVDLNFAEGNTIFKKAEKHLKQNPQAALENYDKAIDKWRQSYKNNSNPNAVKNIEIAKNKIALLKKQMQDQQKQDQNQQNDKNNQNQDNKNNQQNSDSKQNQNRQNQQNEQNPEDQQNKDKSDQQNDQHGNEQNKKDNSQDQSQQQQSQDQQPWEMKNDEQFTAQKIIEQEENRKKQKAKAAAGSGEVEKDW